MWLIENDVLEVRASSELQSGASAHLQRGRARVLFEDEVLASGEGFQSSGRHRLHQKTSPTPAVAPIKMIAAVANEKHLLAYHLEVSQAFTQAPLKEEILPSGWVGLSGKVARLLKSQHDLK